MTPVQKQILSPSYPNGINSGLTYMGPVDWAFVLLKTWGLPSSNYSWQIKKKKKKKNTWLCNDLIYFLHLPDSSHRQGKKTACQGLLWACIYPYLKSSFVCIAAASQIPSQVGGSWLWFALLLFEFLICTLVFHVFHVLRAQERSQHQGSWEEKAGLGP